MASTTKIMSALIVAESGLDLEEYFTKAEAIKKQIQELLKDEHLKDGIGSNSLGYALRDYIKDIY